MKRQTVYAISLLAAGLVQVQGAPRSLAQPVKLDGYFTSQNSELEQISRKRFSDLVAKDTASFRSLYTPDFVAIGPDGKPTDIRFLEAIVKAAPKDFAIKPFDYHVMLLGDGGQAVVYHKSHDVWAGQKSDVAYTEIYVKRSGRWMLQFENYSDIQDATPAK